MKFHPAPLTTAFKTYKAVHNFTETPTNAVSSQTQNMPQGLLPPAIHAPAWRPPQQHLSAGLCNEETEVKSLLWRAYGTHRVSSWCLILSSPTAGGSLPRAAQGKDPMAGTERLLPTQGSTSSSQAEVWPQPDKTLKQSHQLRSFRFLQKPRG